jgi:(E)-4-hydroxy-3-methylbut-2-enyl-diphosphate synthase
MSKSKKTIKIGKVSIGAGYPAAIQSMSDLLTTDTNAVVAQAERLEKLGCKIFRVAVPDEDAAKAAGVIKKSINMPLVADIHYDYKLGIKAAEAGVDKLRINPGNMKKRDLKELVRAVKDFNIPIRVGVNGGSLEKKYETHTNRAYALALSAADGIKFLEDEGFFEIVVSLKSSSVKETVEAYRYMDKMCEYPLHIGVTEAGGREAGIIKSAVGLGSLLLDGIGDTIRVSLTAEPEEEVRAAKRILGAAGVYNNLAEVISCPKCGRCTYDTKRLTEKVEKLTENIEKPLKIAVMGCAVNGPGEARHCDLGIAFGNKKAVVFRKGDIISTVSETSAEEYFLSLIKDL